MNERLKFLTWFLVMIPLKLEIQILGISIRDFGYKYNVDDRIPFEGFSQQLKVFMPYSELYIFSISLWDIRAGWTNISLLWLFPFFKPILKWYLVPICLPNTSPITGTMKSNAPPRWLWHFEDENMKEMLLMVLKAGKK